jgi:periplasmic divalent cation tolerance protein
MEEGFILVMMTASSEDEGALIGETVVGEGLAACCNIVPGVRSIYRWEGKLMDELEVLCIMKTRSTLFEKLKDRIVELHSYEVPEIIGFNIDSFPS